MSAFGRKADIDQMLPDVCLVKMPKKASVVLIGYLLDQSADSCC